MIGQMQMLDRVNVLAHAKANGLDFSKLFTKPPVPAEVALFNSERQDHKIHDIIDRKLIAQSQGALDGGTPVRIELPIRNTDRTTGAMLSGAIAKRYGHDGLPPDTIVAKFKGTAGQSFGAFLARGVSFELEGDANDYVGKGLSGGRIVVRPPAQSGIVPEDSIIIGNTVLYGAIEGECYFRGVAGEALRGAQFRRRGGDRRSRRPLLRIHDRRRRGGARPHRPQLCRRHVGRHRLCARRRRHL